MSIEQTLDREFERLHILPEQKKEETFEDTNFTQFPQLMQEFEDNGEYMKDLQKVNRKLETGIKRMITSENSLQGTYIGVKDFFNEKVYGRITTIDDLFVEMLYTLDMMGDNFQYMIEKGDTKVESLNQYYYALRQREVDSKNKLNLSIVRLEDMKGLYPRLQRHINSTEDEPDNEELLFRKRELVRQICHEEFNISSLRTDADRSGKSRSGVDMLVRLFETINHTNRELLKENRHYSEIVRETIIPYFHFIRTSQNYGEMQRIREDINGLTSKTLQLFKEGSKDIAKAYNKIGKSGIVDKYLLTTRNGLGGKGYLDT